MPATRSDAVKHALGRKDALQRKNPGAPEAIRRLVEQLSGEDLKLILPLLDAAVSGVILGFSPDDPEMRGLAAKSWEYLKPLLSHHLLSEDESVLSGRRRNASSRAKKWRNSKNATRNCARSPRRSTRPISKAAATPKWPARGKRFAAWPSGSMI